MQGEFDSWEAAIVFADSWFAKKYIDLWVFEITDNSNPNYFTYIVSDSDTCIPGINRMAEEVKRYRN